MTNPRGITVYCDTTVSADVCANPDVDIIHIVRNWSDLNPVDGVYVWTSLIQDIGTVVSFGKKFGITVVAGSKSPEWLYTDYSIPSITVDEYATERPVGSITSYTVPVFTDPTYRQLWAQFIEEMSIAFTDNYILVENDIINNLVRITVSGINSHDHVFSMNKQTNITNGITASSDAQQLWYLAGVHSQNVVDVFVEFYYYFEQFFPNVAKVVYLEHEGFPELDELYVDFLLVDTISDSNLPIIPIYNSVSVNEHGRELFDWIRTINIARGGKLNREAFENCDNYSLNMVLSSMHNDELNYKLVELYPANILNTPSTVSIYRDMFIN